MNVDRISILAELEKLETTSDKIRAMARAGYKRTEISQLLGIRYQHVRKVLVDAGIEGGLQTDIERGRPPVSVDADLERRQPISADVLLKVGFRLLGEWVLLEEGEFTLSTPAPADAGVYAFAVDGWIRYVGLTHQGLQTRLSGYRRGYVGQRTNARVKGLIVAALSAGQTVKVLVATPEASEWNGLPVITAAGLEAGLIRMIRPDWNMLGVT